MFKVNDDEIAYKLVRYLAKIDDGIERVSKGTDILGRCYFKLEEDIEIMRSIYKEGMK